MHEEVVLRNNDMTEPTSMTESQPCERSTRRKRPRRLQDDGQDWLFTRLELFKHQQHSLRLSASNIAALSGFHPFKDLPQLFMDLVYQGSTGHLLLKHDSSLLGISLVSNEEIMLQIAQKAGKATSQAVQSALHVKQGSKRVETTHEAQKLKRTVVEEAQKSKKLTKVELQQLQDHVRHSVNTGYGTFHEEEALNLYETQCGWPVKERNEEIMSWPFEQITMAHSGLLPQASVAPLRKATPLHSFVDARMKDDSSQGGGNEEKPSNSTKMDSSKNKNNHKEEISNNHDNNHEEKENCENAPQNNDESVSVESRIGSTSSTSSSSGQDSKDESHVKSAPFQPFFSILGAVDGIREELWCPPNTTTASLTTTAEVDANPEDEEWTMREIVVECKHRMKRAILPPPLYDQIQATAYCLMYGVTDADIVQVTRNTVKRHVNTKNKQRKGDKNSTKTNKKQQQKSLSYTTKGEKETTPGIKTHFSPVSKKEDKNKDTTGTNKDLPLKLEVATKEEATSKEISDTEKPAEQKNAEVKYNTVVDSTTSTKSAAVVDTTKESTIENVPNTEKLGDQTIDRGKNDTNTNGGTSTNLVVDLTNEEVTNVQKPVKENPEEAPAEHAEKNRAKIVINVSRLSLDEPIMQHRKNWNEVVLPRLRSFVDAVYKVRGDDSKRYQLLGTLSMNDGKEEEAWNMLHGECPWLLNCDTAFYKLS